jgi:molybdate transport system substrate-binding protein
MKRLIFVGFMVLAALAGGAAAAAEEITVFAAASLKTALEPIAESWSRQSGISVVLAFDGSAKLAQQVLLGAPADVLISASPEWMEAAAAALQTETRRDFVSNDLVLIGAGDMAPRVVDAGLDLAGLLGDGWLAMGQRDAVPAGQYAQEVLVSLGLWTEVEPQIVEVENVRLALDLVARGEAFLGIVYASDYVAGVAAGMEISRVGRFAAESHRPILYSAALTTQADPRAAEFVAYLAGGLAQSIFAEQGFVKMLP